MAAQGIPGRFVTTGTSHFHSMFFLFVLRVTLEHNVRFFPLAGAAGLCTVIRFSLRGEDWIFSRGGDWNTCGEICVPR